jgi:DinB superfamily
MEIDFANIQGMFKTNTDIVNKAIADVDPEHWFKNPGDDSNHLMWIMGHLVVHRGHTLKMLGVDWDNQWASLFARGAERLEDTEYPSAEEMRSAWQEVSTHLANALQQPSAEVLAKDAPKGPPSFDGKLGGTVAFFAFHDTYHVGQISFLRKWLGYGKTVG